ncbi:hypothetical protein EX30DRAFT_186364 [Ascodesmis nigricans]|uniref:WDR59/RTC1-like RING zinc finger domain-containing protein n=1 Tax=Ascodesmis nigricans TaxID=341454 RepID=A0A4S2N049_9PEZI|nr:hypothetical protein EX30DRAFT_186364 [Ascodesmis nigricans]
MPLGPPAAMPSPKTQPVQGLPAESSKDSLTFKMDMSIKVDAPVGAMSISPCSRDVVLASRQGLHIIDLDNPYDPPRFLQHLTAWSVADVQWSPHASHPNWVVSTSNQNAIVWNLAMPASKSIEFVLKSHTRAISDINFSAHDPHTLATCSIDSFVHCWDLRTYQRPALSFCDWFAGATQVKFNRRDEHILASAHDKYVYIWDTRMGAKELRKITAHSTKIYGLDWNRTRKTGFLTCALDKSVRFWDYEKTPSSDIPDQVIHTAFPVWRARHTPFGWGVMTMPQRGDTSLYMWDSRAVRASKEPIHKFDGHTDNVKEFVWRWRGGDQDDRDDREFQLISWGLDRELRLWEVDKELTAKVGHDPNKKLRFRITRKGAKYQTYRNEEAIQRAHANELREAAKGIPKFTLTTDGRITPRSGIANGEGGISLLSGTGLGQQLNGTQGLGMAKRLSEDRRFEKSLAGTREGGFMRTRRKTRTEMNPIAWMRGVKIGRKVSEHGQEGSRTSAQGADFTSSWEAPEKLGDEVSYVGSKFRNVKFEKVNIAQRVCTFSLTGPWGVDHRWIFIRAQASFPEGYPTDGESIPEFQLEKTNIIPEEHVELIDIQLKRIASARVSRKRVCLEACLSYLLGEHPADGPLMGSDRDDESTTDDEEIVNISSHGDDEEGMTSHIHRTDQASVPLPTACGVTWSPDGRLICFFPPKEERPKFSLFSTLSMGDNERARGPNGNRMFEGFGRLFLDNAGRDTDTGENGSDSSFSSDSSDADTTIHPGATIGWNLRNVPTHITRGFKRGRSTDRSTQRSTGTGVKTVTAISKGKTLVSIHDMSHLLPAKQSLAVDYRIGEGPEVCRYNAEVAKKHGYPELADIWCLLEMVLCNDVPLNIYQNPKDRFGNWGDKVMVVAKRAALEKSRRDSGLGLDLDDDSDFERMDDVEFWGKVKWGAHPMGGGWLIPQIFAYFESIGDVQMLAMLSCVLTDSEASSGKNHLTETRAIDIPDSKRRSSVSRDYYPNVEMIVQSQQAAFSISPAHHSVSLTPIGPSGSYSSSPGRHFGSDPTHTLAFSAGTTPPGHLFDYGLYSLSSSPEVHHHHTMGNFRRSNSNISANFSRALMGASNASPPSRRRPSPADSLVNAFATSSAVTWGAITTFGSGSKGAAERAVSETMTDDNSSESGDSEYSPDPIIVTMHNSKSFDTEANISSSLLDSSRGALYRAWRDTYANLLYAWGLQTRRLEILKFNSIAFAPSEFDPHQHHSTVSSSPNAGSVYPDFGRHTRRHQSTSSVIGSISRTVATAPAKWDGLEMAGCCNRCGAVLDVTSGAKGECKACKRRQLTMVCVICHTVVKGLYTPCLQCGHVCHAECHRSWFFDINRDEDEYESLEDEGGGMKEKADNVDEECPAGCGCVCVYGAEEKTDEQYSTQATGGSSLSTRGGRSGRPVGVTALESYGAAGMYVKGKGAVMYRPPLVETFSDPWGEHLW